MLPQSPALLRRKGAIVGASGTIGHRLRDGLRPVPAADRWRPVGVVIVGGGIAGLSAAWRLGGPASTISWCWSWKPHSGRNFASGKLGGIPCPWGAHYLPVASQGKPCPVQPCSTRLGVLEGRDADGEPIVAEQFLCRDPQERLFFDGTWHEGLVPTHRPERRRSTGLGRVSEADQPLGRVGAMRAAGGPSPCPLATCSDDAEVTALDRMSMADWLGRQKLKSPRLRWLVDYACRDDFGLTVEQTSAWAGLFYFVSASALPGPKPQPLLTWPEGNGRFVDHPARAAR